MTHPFPAKEKSGSPVENIDPLVVSDDGFHGEPNFDHLLYLERKRTERSRRPFLLVLLNIEGLLAAGAGHSLVKKLESALSSCVRETDIRGWYEQGKTIGIIFTEMGAIEEIVGKKIFLKIQENLCEKLGSETVQRIKVSYHVFPEAYKGNEGHQEWFNFRLYPELTNINNSKRILLFVKRTMDLLGSLLGLIILSPVFLLITLAVKLTSKGPVFFRQERIGRGGKKFIFLKFRSMQGNCDQTPHKDYVANFISSGEEGGAQNKGEPVTYKLRNDCRITPVGKFLRKTSLDELPQFINVLKGEMSIVGPRPPIDYEVNLYDIWHRKRLLEAKPGITGLWQVEGRSKRTFNDMVRLDLKYINEWSLWLDFKIILKTPWVMITGSGGY